MAACLHTGHRVDHRRLHTCHDSGMKALFFTPAVFSLAVLGAHFLRYGNEAGVAVSLAPIALLFVRKPWAPRVVQVVLVLGSIEWVRTLYELVQMRLAQGIPVARLVIILGAVVFVTAVSALLFETPTMKRIYKRHRGDAFA